MRLTDEQRAAIARDPRPHKDIAAEFGICRHQVSTIKQRAGTAGTRIRPVRGNRAVARKPLPDRHYRPCWDEPEARS